jgi:AcrR family transcriptional regulator
MATKREPQASPRERLLDTAAALFYREGINGVGVDRVLAEAGVTRATMYRHFAGKEALVVAYLEREDAAIREVFEKARAAGGTPRGLLGAAIDGIAQDATRRHTRGCPFINASAEFPDPKSDVRQVVKRHRTWFRNTLVQLAQAAGVPDPKSAGAQLVLLRDAMLVGNYLDGRNVQQAFRSAARTVAALD